MSSAHMTILTSRDKQVPPQNSDSMSHYMNVPYNQQRRFSRKMTVMTNDMMESQYLLDNSKKQRLLR